MRNWTEEEYQEIVFAAWFGINRLMYESQEKIRKYEELKDYESVKRMNEYCNRIYDLGMKFEDEMNTPDRFWDAVTELRKGEQQ